MGWDVVSGSCQLSLRHHSERLFIYLFIYFYLFFFLFIFYFFFFFCLAFYFQWKYFVLIDHIRTHLSFLFLFFFFFFFFFSSNIYPKINFKAKNWSDLCNFYSKVIFCLRKCCFLFIYLLLLLFILFYFIYLFIYLFYFIFFFSELNYWCFTTILWLFQKKKKKKWASKICWKSSQVTYPTD